MKIDHIHFFVEDAAQTRDWLIQKMGFQSGGYQVNEHTRTELVGNSSVLFRVSAALGESSPVAHYLADHPAGVANIAFLVDDLESLSARITRLGIKVIEEYDLAIDHTEQLTIQGWGDCQHTLRTHPSDPIWTSIRPEPDDQNRIVDIDHVVLNVDQHQLAAATDWYQNLFDFQVKQSFDIQSNYSGLYSHALVDHTGQVQFNINEPSSPNSQIQTFLNAHGGAGIQHVALRSANIFQTVTEMRSQDLAFLPIPPSYYANLKCRSQQVTNFPFSHQEWQDLEKLEILLDWPSDHDLALLMQIFTQPIFAQPTFFFELIERRGSAQGFGEGNFLALFQAIEQEELKKPVFTK
jgi:4-hydroxyphenylpyruvate dioxygenase